MIEGRCISKKAKSASKYSQKIRAEAKKSISEPFLEKISVVIDLFLRGSSNRPDIDNATKVILDALKGVAYQDDKEVIKLEVAVHNVDNKMKFVEQPLFLVDPLMKGIREYSIIRIYEP